MNSATDPEFWQLYRQLPRRIRLGAREAYRRFDADPAHPGLRFHRLRTREEFWSVRITLDYRAVGLLEGDTITWFWIGTHSDFDREFS